MSFLKNLMYLYLSFLPAAFNSMLNVGFTTILLNPQPNSIGALLGTISLFSKVLLILKCIVDTLHSWGNIVDRMNQPSLLSFISSKVASLSMLRTIVKNVPLMGSPSASTSSFCCFSSPYIFSNLKIFEYSTGRFS